MKYLVTGVSGFVGRHLCDRLLAQGHSVYGVDMAAAPALPPEVKVEMMSLMDTGALGELVARLRPDRLVHLASASSVGLSWEKPVDCFVNNTNIFLNLVEAVRAEGVCCRILSVGSSEEYGPVDPSDVPLREDRPPNPMNPYAVARVAQEHLSRVYVHGYGLDIVCTRSFNHLGPGQTDRFVVSSFVRQAIEVSLGRRKELVCGNLDIVRDLVDVRDVVAAYDLILEKGVKGEIYNVCRGEAISLRDLLGRICALTGIPARWQVDPALVRPIDNPVIIGNPSRLNSLGFSLAYDLDQSLADLIAWWKARLA